MKDRGKILNTKLLIKRMTPPHNLIVGGVIRFISTVEKLCSLSVLKRKRRKETYTKREKTLRKWIFLGEMPNGYSWLGISVF